MENKQNNNKFVIICLVIVIIALIGVIAFMFVNQNNTSLNNGANQNNNMTNNNNETNNNGSNNNSNSNNNGGTIARDFDLDEAEDLFDKVVKDPAIEYAILGAVGELKVTNMDNTQLGALLLADIDEDEYLNICGTQSEEDLKSLGIIGARGVGQYDCSNVIVVSLDEVNEASKDLFGKILEFNTAGADNFYYYEKGKIAVFKYTTVGFEDWYFKLDNYYINDNIATIEIKSTPSYANYKYKINFEVSGDDYYLYSISKG